MQPLSQPGDGHLIQIVDAALADAVRRSGMWLACRPGCSQCCYGVFEITGLDAARLRAGLANMELEEPARAARVRSRVDAAEARLAPWFPGDLSTGVLTGTEEAIELFQEFASADACPVLDPATQTCDLYQARPILCRTFGPPVRHEAGEAEGGLAVCELNFVGAAAEEVAAAEMDSSFRGLEQALLESYGEQHPEGGPTVVAFAFRVAGAAQGDGQGSLEQGYV